ncbi:MAG: hypothetical protein MJY82_08870 [Fibrobacter sp.]|nr:hypothetical protein [Fibrobacter sp.]
MQLRSSCLLLALALCIATLFGCSRESSIKENVSLRNNHSVVFAFNKPFKDAEAFADSIINLSNPDSVLVYDTLTITVNDTVYLMGFLRYNADKIYRYIWHFEEPYNKENGDSLKKDCEFYSQGKTSKGCNYVTESSDNAKPHFKVYTQAGLYSPLFIAIDGNNARDTAGVGQYVRVINTAPYLSVPKDTLWTRSKGDITFPIVALDSFGSIKNIKVDLDASGKNRAEKWKYKERGGDTLEITIKYDKDYVDSLGNQMIYVIVIDDDDNETIDSVNLHFNQKPKLTLISPEDNSTQNEQERLILNFNATDKDNPAALRYFIRAANPIQSDTSIEEFVPNFTDRYLIAENIKEPYYVAVSADGENQLGLSGRIYWDVWVTDGYDTVYADKIKESDGSLRPRTFLLVDLKNPYGVFTGFVQYDGRSNHSGILVMLQDSVNKYYAVTDNKGYFSKNVPSGSYRLIASDTSGNGYAPESLSYRHVEVGQTVRIGNLTLKDTVNPIVTFDNIYDTLNVRSIDMSGKIQDIGSQVKNVYAWLDNDELEFKSDDESYFGGYNKLTNNWTWSMKLKDLIDGEHVFKILAKDSAGNNSDTLKMNFVVHATNLTFTVNDVGKKMVRQNDSLTFKAIVKNAEPKIDTIYFTSNVSGAKTFKSIVKNDTATIKLKLNDFPTGLVAGKFYTMVAKGQNDQPSARVDFGFYGTEPIVYFETPADSTQLSVNDEISYKVVGLANNDDINNEQYTLSWDCAGITPCIEDNTHEGKFKWSKAGVQKLYVTIKNEDGKTSKDSLTVIVLTDPPTIKVKTDSKLTQKINSVIDVNVSASDKFGNIEKLEWGCSNGNILTFDNSKTFTEQSSINTNVTVTLPGEASDKYRCVFKATDDDGETASDTLTFKIILDLPYVSLNIKKQTLTINDEVDFDFMAGDTLGKLVKFEKACSQSLESLDSWDEFTSYTTVTMPNTPGDYYCAIQVTDDDGNTARDTATYKVLRAGPWVSIMGVSTVTIKDVINLDADVHDTTQYDGTFLNGGIVKYEWGCGTKGNIQLQQTSTTTPEYQATMPSTPNSDYLCVIQVTDDDGNTARDTAHINVILDPPSVTVERETATIRPGVSFILDATANDGYGEIVKKEWSCGTPSDIENNWKEVDDFYTSWVASSVSLNYLCIVRATDDDGNTARDTMRVQFSTDMPVITVQSEVIYVVPGMEFDLSATKNDNVWSDENVSWYQWQCYYADNDKQIKSESKYDFNHNLIVHDNGDTTKFYKHQDESYTEKGKDIYCVVSAEESSTGATFSDTTQIKIIVNPPTGVITAADTVYLWSGDSTLSNEAIYFYTEEWGGMNSKMGPIGDANNQTFRWKFSNVGSDYYLGRSDGTIDTNILQFNEAFIRATTESSMKICLDYRDSSASVVNEAFYLRHRADEVCRNVYFRKAWQNLASNGDTLLDRSTIGTSPILTTVGNKPVEIYLTSATTVTTKYLNGTTWTSISGSNISVSDSIVSLQVASNGKDLFLAVLTSGKKLTAYKSTNGTSAWAKLGSTEISTSATGASIACKNQGDPVVAFIASSDKKLYFSRWNGSTWSSTQVKDVTNANEVKAAFTENGRFVIVYVNSSYKGYYVLYDSGFNFKLRKDFRDEINGISVASDEGNIYIGFMSRKTDYNGPTVYKGTVQDNQISFDKSSVFTDPIKLSYFATHTDVAAKNGKVYVAIDARSQVSQIDVFRLDGNSWKIYGENNLPYFMASFYKKNNYYLRGLAPSLAISDEEKVYISMLARKNTTENLGPIVMKYVADTWEVK